MFSVHDEPLPVSQQEAIRKLFVDNGYLALVKVIEHELRRKCVAATEKAAEAEDYASYTALVDANLRDARRLKTCLDVLEEFRKRETPFVTVQIR